MPDGGVCPGAWDVTERVLAELQGCRGAGGRMEAPHLIQGSDGGQAVSTRSLPGGSSWDSTAEQPVAGRRGESTPHQGGAAPPGPLSLSTREVDKSTCFTGWL